ncbi:MAG: hypothetical protein JWM86_2153 [Thermoleophilia bacterium]|nr:hypothetical protein [Thermoleophilia bacterium]
MRIPPHACSHGRVRVGALHRRRDTYQRMADLDPALPAHPDPSSRVRARARSCARTRERGAARPALLATLVVLLAVAIAVGARSPQPASAGTVRAAATDATIPAIGQRWFALGGSVPFVRWRCDFGCGLGGGVRGTRAQVDTMLRTMSRRGTRVVRWYLLPDDAWQIRRTADGTPTSLDPNVLADLDVAVDLAAKHDVFLLPVVLPTPSSVPSTWYADAAQSQALATVLTPMFRRYRAERHVLGWELATGAESLVDSGLATRDQARASVGALVAAMKGAAPGKLATIGPGDVSRIDSWTGLGAELYTPAHMSSMSNDACAACRTAADVAAAEGADAPIVIGAFDAATPAMGAARLGAYARLGYAGALGWSWRSIKHPAQPSVSTPYPDDAIWRFYHSSSIAGPRSRPRNPCTGPAVLEFRCPNLVMSPPRDVRKGRIGFRTILYSTNSLDSHGAGPASLRGTRAGRLTMVARQVLHRRSGPPITIDTDARLLFKAIPGQYRYWKWNGAARMELWRLDSTGTPVERTVVGPKTVYCLRDLRRTASFLPRSPRSRVFPACSQDPTERVVTLGTSVGWSDVYPATYHENWIEVTGLRGCFAYVHVADPTNAIYESNEDDNTSRVVVKLPWTGSNRGCPGAKPIPTTGVNGSY